MGFETLLEYHHIDWYYKNVVPSCCYAIFILPKTVQWELYYQYESFGSCHWYHSADKTIMLPVVNCFPLESNGDSLQLGLFWNGCQVQKQTLCQIGINSKIYQLYVAMNRIRNSERLRISTKRSNNKEDKCVKYNVFYPEVLSWRKYLWYKILKAICLVGMSKDFNTKYFIDFNDL